MGGSGVRRVLEGGPEGERLLCWRRGRLRRMQRILPATAPRVSLHARPCVGARELPGARPGRGGLPNTFGPVLFTAEIFNEP